MQLVMLYSFQGTYIGLTDYDCRTPEVGTSHKCMLFLSQTSADPTPEDALIECAKYGFSKVEFNGAGPLKVEALNSDQFRGFVGLYEKALSEGSALVYSANTRTDSRACH